MGTTGTGPGGGDEVFLVIEVADSSLDGDRGEKAQLYAEAEIPDYWIVNLIDCCVEVRRDPQGGHCQTLTTHRAGEEIRPLLFPGYPFFTDHFAIRCRMSGQSVLVTILLAFVRAAVDDGPRS